MDEMAGQAPGGAREWGMFLGLFLALKEMLAQSEKEQNKADAQVYAHCEVEELLRLWKPKRRARSDAPYHFGFGLLSFTPPGF